MANAVLFGRLPRVLGSNLPEHIRLPKPKTKKLPQKTLTIKDVAGWIRTQDPPSTHATDNAATQAIYFIRIFVLLQPHVLLRIKTKTKPLRP